MVKNYLCTHNIKGSVTRYLQQQLEATVSRHMQDPHNTHAIGGDFNANWKDSPRAPKRSHTAIGQFAEQLGLHNPLHNPETPEHYTRTIGSHYSCIDHVLYTPLSATHTASGTNYAAMWGKHTDHRPLWVALQLESPMAPLPPRNQPKYARYGEQNSTAKIRRR